MRMFSRCWHNWVPWKTYYHTHTIWDSQNQNEVIERRLTLRQFRACLKCGFAEDLIVANGTGGPIQIRRSGRKEESKNEIS